MMNVPMGRDRIVQPSALHLSPELRHIDLPPVQVVNVLASREAPSSPQTGVAEIVVQTPETRCRVKGVLLWVPRSTNLLVSPADYWPAGPRNLFGATSIWLAKRDESAVNGRGAIPVENLAGDIFAGLQIPEPGCLGWMFEVQTSGQEVWGRFAVDATATGAGQWMLKATCDAIDPMTDVEWNRVHSRFACRVVSGAVLQEGRPA